MLEPIIIVVGGWRAVTFGGMWEREVLDIAFYDLPLARGQSLASAFLSCMCEIGLLACGLTLKKKEPLTRLFSKNRLNYI